MLYSIPWMQSILADALFGYKPVSAKLKKKFTPRGFPGFFERSKSAPDFKDHFSGCVGKERFDIKTRMTQTGNTVALDVVSIEPEDLEEIEQPKHIINFQGVFAHYESYDCYIAYSKIAKEQRAKVYAFNYPGIHRSKPDNPKDSVKEFNDLVNSGIAIVNKLLKEGVHPDKIILQGNCIGSAVAHAVQNEFWKKNIKLRVIASNSYASFKGIAKSFTTQKNINPIYLLIIKFFFNFVIIKPLRKYILKKIGWDSSITRSMKAADPYCQVIQREQDLAFRTGKLQEKLEHYRSQRQQRHADLQQIGKSRIKNRPDNCPDEYKIIRDRLDKKSILKPKRSELSKTAIFKYSGAKIQKLLVHSSVPKNEQKKFLIKAISSFVDTTNNVEELLKSKNLSTEYIKKIISLMQQANTEANRKKVCSHPLGLMQIEGYFELLDEYLTESDKYISTHPQSELTKEDFYNLPSFLNTAVKQPGLLHIIIEGLFYSLIPLGFFALIANPLVLPAIISLIFTNVSISFGFIYAIAAPIIIISSLIFAADFWGDTYGPKEANLKSDELEQVITERLRDDNNPITVNPSSSPIATLTHLAPRASNTSDTGNSLSLFNTQQEYIVPSPQ